VQKVINLALVAVIAALILIWLFVDLPLSSPLGENALSRFLPFFPHLKTQKIVYGFLPYWNLDEVVVQPELTHLAYFALAIDTDGTIVTKLDGNAEPGFHQLQSEEFLAINNTAKAYGTRTDIVLSQFDNETIEEFLQSDQAQAAFLNSVDSLLLAYPFNGINLDIEYIGDAPPQLRERFTQFVAKLRTHLNETYDDIQLTVDMYAAASSKNQLWEVDKVAPLVDHIVIMAYDFHRSSSLRAGPVAPLFDKENSWSESINNYLKDFTKKAPADKLLLGIPFYGYEWQTTTTDPEAFTLPQSGATASYKRVQELIAAKDELQLTEHWEESALAPFLSYVKNNQPYLVYYEDSRSIGYKLDYVNQLDLAGVAIWSLGYEGSSRDLWETMDQQLKIEN
jgi:spore germination protein YaaH